MSDGGVAVPSSTISHESLTTTMLADLLAMVDYGSVQGHALFFDALVQLIPPRFYLQATNEDYLWYQGLSKFAKVAMKAQSHANLKARGRLTGTGSIARSRRSW